MKIIFIILGLSLFLTRSVWFSLFMFCKQRILERIADRHLADYKEDETIPAATMAKLFSSGIRTLLLHLGGAFLLMSVGIHLLVLFFIL